MTDKQPTNQPKKGGTTNINIHTTPNRYQQQQQQQQQSAIYIYYIYTYEGASRSDNNLSISRRRIERARFTNDLIISYRTGYISLYISIYLYIYIQNPPSEVGLQQQAGYRQAVGRQTGLQSKYVFCLCLYVCVCVFLTRARGSRYHIETVLKKKYFF